MVSSFFVSLVLAAGLVKPPLAVQVIPDRAVDLIIAFEVGSPEVYQKKYTRPICPACETTASGVTIGIGYDLGHRAANVIVLDWEVHPERAKFATVAGITGPLALDALRRVANVTIEYGLARQVFDQTSVIEHYRQARRIFPGMHELSPYAQGALVSVVFNRGQSMAGPKRVEMRHIRDHCIPKRDHHCIADQLRKMARHWVGTTIENGMRKRRYAEAELALYDQAH